MFDGEINKFFPEAFSSEFILYLSYLMNMSGISISKQEYIKYITGSDVSGDMMNFLVDVYEIDSDKFEQKIPKSFYLAHKANLHNKAYAEISGQRILDLSQSVLSLYLKAGYEVILMDQGIISGHEIINNLQMVNSYNDMLKSIKTKYNTLEYIYDSDEMLQIKIDKKAKELFVMLDTTIT